MCELRCSMFYTFSHFPYMSERGKSGDGALHCILCIEDFYIQTRLLLLNICI